MQITATEHQEHEQSPDGTEEGTAPATIERPNTPPNSLLRSRQPSGPECSEFMMSLTLLLARWDLWTYYVRIHVRTREIRSDYALHFSNVHELLVVHSRGCERRGGSRPGRQLHLHREALLLGCDGGDPPSVEPDSLCERNTEIRYDALGCHECHKVLWTYFCC